MNLKYLDYIFKNRNCYFDAGRGCLCWIVSVEMVRLSKYKTSVIHHVVDDVVYINPKEVMFDLFFFTNFFVELTLCHKSQCIIKIKFCTSNKNITILFNVKIKKNLNANFKRNVSRKLQKAYTGLDDAKSKKLDPLDLTGYSLFQIVQPPYNVMYLAQLYDISPYHHAAVDAKVANTVGLGYIFEENQIPYLK